MGRFVLVRRYRPDTKEVHWKSVILSSQRHKLRKKGGGGSDDGEKRGKKRQ